MAVGEVVDFEGIFRVFFRILDIKIDFGANNANSCTRRRVSLACLISWPDCSKPD